ncbi:MAG TPA: hypothetical protein VHX86_07150 [Tepidisphaeraceae bacterium]|jgi:hypothetical protein|nr:hypothetical protein [Tepidisphaeraceae bacterium]
MRKDFLMHPFFVADLNTRGELKQVTPYDYATLERIPGASDLIGRCSGELWKSPDQMEMVLSDAGDTGQQMVEALADRAFAAAYFRYLGLA